MGKIEQMRNAIKMLEELGLPISKEQRFALQNAEYEFIDNEILPKLTEDLTDMFTDIVNPFKIEIAYMKGHDLVVNRVDEPHKDEQTLLSEFENDGSRKKTFIIKVTFPDGTVFCDRIVKNTIVETIRHIGCQKIYELKIPVLGMYLVDKYRHENPSYAASQTEVEPGFFLLITGNSERKIDMLNFISEQLNLDLIIEKVAFETLMNREELLKRKRSKRTTYSLEGGKFTTKSFFVLELVERILSDNHNITFEELEKIMPITSQNNRTLIRCDQWMTKNEDAKSRYISFRELSTGDGVKFYVSNQWTQDTFEKKIYPILRQFNYYWEEK